MANPMEMVNGVEQEMSDADYAALQAMQANAVAQSAISQLKSQAQTALDTSDMVCLRCYKAAVAFPSEWQTYVTALRAIVNSGTGTIPTQPSYPEGT